MNLTVRPVHTDYCAQTWPLVEKYIASAYEIGYTEYTLEQAKLMVCSGMWDLFVAADDENNLHGAATVQFINYPNSRVAFIAAIGGRLITNRDTAKQLADILKQRGATSIQGGARPSVVRLWRRFGYETVSTIVELKL